MSTKKSPAVSQNPDVRLVDQAPPSTESSLAAARERLKGGRNEPCQCGSGRKYKKCCLHVDEVLVRQAAAESRSVVAADVPPGVAAGTGAERVASRPKTRVMSETERRLDELWRGFDSLSEPSTAQMDELLDELLALPPEATARLGICRAIATAGIGLPYAGSTRDEAQEQQEGADEASDQQPA